MTYIPHSSERDSGSHMTLAPSDLGTGTPSATTVLLGTGVWGSATGTIADGTKGHITTSSSGSTWTINTGVVTAAMTTITGTPTGSKFLRDDWSWQTPAGGPGGDSSIARSFLLMGA